MSRIKKTLLGLTIPVIVVALWLYATNFLDVSPSILPRISKVGIALVDLIKKGTLQKDISISLVRVVRGYFFAISIGIILGTAMGMFPVVYQIFHGPITTIRQIPNIAWIPLIILWFGIKELSKTVIIVIAAFFPVMTNTLNGILSTPHGFIELAQLYNLSKWKTFRKVYLPHALPHILVGLKLGLGVSWMALVAAELIASSSGIGYRLSDARSLMRSDIVIVCMIVIGITGIIMDKIISLIFRFLTPWEKKKADI